MKKLLIAILITAGTVSASFAQQMIVGKNNEKGDPNAPLSYAIKGNEVRTESGGVSFEPGTANILPASLRTLNTVKKFLDDKSYVSTLRIEGHTDCGAGAQPLSERRANAIAKWLVSAGVDCKRLTAVGFGCTKPIVDIGYNERVTFVIAALRGHAIGGAPLDGGGRIAGDACAP